MGLSKRLTPELWEEWQGSLATQTVQSALSDMIHRQRQAATAAYWAGNPWPESERLALSRMAAWHEDFFTATLDEITEALREDGQ